MEYQSLSEFIRRYVIRWSWLLFLAMFLAGDIAYVVSIRMTPIYQASTTLLVEKAPGSVSSEYSAILASELLTQTYAEMVTTRPVIEETIAWLLLNTDVESLLETINVKSLPDTRLIELQVEHSNPSQAALIANTIVEVFSEYNQGLQDERYAASKQSLQEQLEQINEQIQSVNLRLKALESVPGNQNERDRLETLLTDYQKSYIPLLQSYEEIRVLEASSAKIIQLGKAVPPDEFIRPRIWINTILAATVGLMLAAGIIYLIETLDDSIKYPEDITKQFGIPILGMITYHKPSDKDPITLSAPLSPLAEAYRSLRENIRNMDVENLIKSLVISSASAEPGAGVSTVAANLAVVFAQAKLKVVLIDTDLRRPKIQDIFNVPNKSGLLDLITFPEINKINALKHSEVPGLSIITSGGSSSNPSDLLSSKGMISLLKDLRSQADMVVIDTAPINLVSDAISLSRNVDGVILIVRPEHTTRSSIKNTIEQYERIGAIILGIVVNGYKPSRLSSYYYRYRYYPPTKNDQHGAGEKKHKRKFPTVALKKRIEWLLTKFYWS